MRKIVGISSKIKRAWLDALLDQLAKTTDEAELRAFLDQRLRAELPGAESRVKTAGILLRIWFSIPPERVALRDWALSLLPRISGQERIWLHWGMAALAYPFFRDTAEVVGRLLALQDDFTSTHVQARMIANWGDRVTSKEAAQKLITTLVDWEVLRSTKTKGHFLLARKMKASIPELQVWLLDALLSASAFEEIEAQQLLRLPETFPFTLDIGVANLRSHEGFNIHRQGLDMDMIAPVKVKLAPQPKPVKTQSKKKAQARPSTLKPSPVSKPASLSNDTDPFADPLFECAELYRDRHFFACIALAQSIIEAEIRRISHIKLKKKSNQLDNFEKNVANLHKKQLIADVWKNKLDQFWKERHLFHNLQLSVESDRTQLEATALNTINLLVELDRELFPIELKQNVKQPA